MKKILTLLAGVLALAATSCVKETLAVFDASASLQYARAFLGRPCLSGDSLAYCIEIDGHSAILSVVNNWS